ncbi:MAG: hypothetical protein COB66_03025 [Coxiella sp. (in: Bacteria)]|nr:MAG: hypothetical protein COB66_03025 [Coxiella sp. (in: g-proteobacteria)]
MALSLTTSLASILGVWIVVVIMPGPNLFLTVSTAIRQSRSRGLALSLGTAIWCVMSLLGLGVLLKTSAQLYDSVKLIGAMYLIYLGIKLLISTHANVSMPAPHDNVRTVSIGKTLLKGMLVDLSNPKAALFFASLFAVAVPPAAPLSYKLILVLSVVVIAGGWYAMVASIVTSNRLMPVHRGVRRLVSYISSAVLIGFGVSLLFKEQ